MKELTIIIPVDVMDDNRLSLFETAYKSIEKDTNVIVIGPSAEIEKIKAKGVTGKKTVFVENDDVNFQKQVNLAVEKVKTDYFSILEYDDVFTKNWFKNLDTWMTANPGLFAYLPINELFAYGDNEHILGYVNEPVWASSFSEKLGFFDTESLMNYMNVGCSGGAFRTEDFVLVGGLKESMKLSFWFEFLLRANSKAKDIYVIPKVGYRHCVNRPESLSYVYQSTMTQEEADWWMNLAKEEYYFKKDRNKQYKK